MKHEEQTKDPSLLGPLLLSRRSKGGTLAPIIRRKEISEGGGGGVSSGRSRVVPVPGELRHGFSRNTSSGARHEN